MKKHLPVIGALCAGTLFLAASGILVFLHLMLLRTMREQTLPLASELPPLERRLQMLQQQLELTELQASLRSGSPEEKLHAYVLPRETDLPRLLAFFDVTRILLERAGMLRTMSSIDVGDAETVEGSDGDQGELQRQTVSLSATLSPEGTERLLVLLDLTGLLTVGDALTGDEVDKFFAITEAENYAAVPAMEKFLDTDLLSYAREPRPAEEQLLKSFTSERFLQEFRGLVASSRLATAQDALASWGEAYAAQRVWPVQFLQPQRISVEPLSQQWNKVSVELALYSRPIKH